MQFVGRLDREMKDATLILDYNGRLFRFAEGDIPSLKGTGLVVVVTRPGLHYQGHRGNFDNINMRQIDGASFINGVNVEYLVTKMEELKE